MSGNDRKLNALWQRFESACQQRAYALAVQSLAELGDEVANSQAPEGVRREWSRKIAAVDFDDNIQSHIHGWARGYIERVNLVVSTGGQLDSYDRLYVTTALNCLQSVQNLLQHRNLAFLIDLDAIDPDAFRSISI